MHSTPVTEHGPEERRSEATDLPARTEPGARHGTPRTMLGEATAHLGAGAVQRKIAQRLARKTDEGAAPSEGAGESAEAKVPRTGDTGIVLSEATVKIGDQETKLEAGTVVEVISMTGEKLKVKVYSGHGGAVAELDKALFRHQPGVAINSRTDKQRGDVYADFSAASLWGDAGPKPDDVRQGAIADCYLIAAMGAVCAANPGAIKRMFSPQTSGAKSYTVTLYKQVKGKLTPQSISVDAQLPALNAKSPEPGAASPTGAPQLAYAGKGSTAASAVLWPALVEKAYAEMVGGYDEAGKGGAASDALTAITGEQAAYESAPKSLVLERFKKYKDEGKAVVCGTLGSMEHKAEKAFRADGDTYRATLTTHEGEPCSLVKNTLGVKDTASKHPSESNDVNGKLVGPAIEAGTVEHATGRVEARFKKDKGPDAPDNLTAEYDFRGKISKALNLYAWHAYIFERIEGDTLIFKNPWGTQHPLPVSAEQFSKLFSSVYSDVVPKSEEPPPGGSR